ncbi:MAG: Oligopeptide transport ATP-binding protein OppD, partial [uncultured Acidimicrobiales bacterium]
GGGARGRADPPVGRRARQLPDRRRGAGGGQRRVLRGAQERGAGHRRRVGVRQERDLDGHPRPPAADGQGQRPHLVRGQRPAGAARSRPAEAAGGPDLHGLPGRPGLAEPGVHRGQPDRRSRQGSPGHQPSRSPPEVHRPARPRRHPQPRGAGRPVPPRVLRRDAAAGGDRHGPGQRPRRADRGRAHDGARRHDPGSGARGARAHPAADVVVDRAHHPRPRSRRRRGRPGARHVRGPPDRRGDGRGDLLRAPAPVHPGPPGLAAPPRPERREHPPLPDQGSATVPAQPARWMRVPPPLRSRPPPRAVRHRGPGPPAGGARPPLGLPLRRDPPSHRCRGPPARGLEPGGRGGREAGRGPV